MNTARFHRDCGSRMSVALLVALLMCGGASVADAIEPTSCDVKTGASCLWGEGCDCDHDGYVLEKGKASKYCHFDKCPIDANDGNAKILGKVSAKNADGDGFTAAYDCNDKDPCVGKTCGVSTCQGVTPDPDAGSTDAGPVDAGSVDTGSSDPGPPDTGPVDTEAAETGPVDAAVQTGEQDGTAGTESLADGGASEVLVSDENSGALANATTTLVGGGVHDKADPPAPGCAARPASSDPSATLGALLLLMALLVLGRTRLRKVLAVIALAMCAVGCVQVQPWQRERLSHRGMVIGRNSGELQLEQHAFQYREGAAGGFGGGGGGCGCN